LEAQQVTLALACPQSHMQREAHVLWRRSLERGNVVLCPNFLSTIGAIQPTSTLADIDSENAAIFCP
jgi:hypothetical protein